MYGRALQGERESLCEADRASYGYLQEEWKKEALWFADKNKLRNFTLKSGEMPIMVHPWFTNKSCLGNWLYARLGEQASKVTTKLGDGTEMIE